MELFREQTLSMVPPQVLLIRYLGPAIEFEIISCFNSLKVSRHLFLVCVLISSLVRKVKNQILGPSRLAKVT